MLIDIFTKDQCPACQKAKQILENFNYSYKEWVIGKDITREEVLKRFPGVKMVPIVLVDHIRCTVEDLQLLLEQDNFKQSITPSILHG